PRRPGGGGLPSRRRGAVLRPAFVRRGGNGLAWAGGGSRAHGRGAGRGALALDRAEFLVAERSHHRRDRGQAEAPRGGEALLAIDHLELVAHGTQQERLEDPPLGDAGPERLLLDRRTPGPDASDLDL